MTRLSSVGQFDFNQFVQTAQNVVQTGINVANDPLAAAVRSVTFFTNYSPVQTYTGQQLSEIYRDPTPNRYLSIIQPTISVDTPLGRRTIAPYGVANVANWKSNVAQVALLVGGAALLTGVGIFVWGRSVGRKGG